MLTSFHTRYALLVCSPNTQRRSDGISSLIALCRSNQSIERIDCVQASITWLVLILSSPASVIAALHWLRQRVVNEGRPFGSQAPHGLLQYEVVKRGVVLSTELYGIGLQNRQNHENEQKSEKSAIFTFLKEKPSKFHSKTSKFVKIRQNWHL